MFLACSSLILKEESLFEKARKLKQLGYAGMSIFIDYGQWNDSIRNEIRMMKETTGIIPCELVFSNDTYGHLMDADPEVRSKARAMYCFAAQICSEIGAVTELEYSYGPRNPLPVYNPYLKMDESEKKCFLDMYRSIQSFVAGSSGYVLLENINRYESPYLNSIADCVDMIDELNLLNTGILCDTFHMSIEEADIPASIRLAGSRIKHVHLGDNNRLMPGRGNLDWNEIFGALNEIGYSRFCTLECAPIGNIDDELKAVADYLLPLMG